MSRERSLAVALPVLILMVLLIACGDDNPETPDTTPPPVEMVLVPAGTFEMGDGAAWCGTDLHQVTLTHSFYMGKYEVTNKEYRDALQWAYSSGHVTADTAAVSDNLDGSTALLVNLAGNGCQISFSDGTFAVDEGKGDYPVAFVSWYGAAAYCDWVSMQAGLARAYDHSTWECNVGSPYTAQGYRLPTDAEWEYAAQYDDERIYPWGDEAPDCSRANFYSGDYCVGTTSPVGSCEAGKSYLGLYDMAGNVWEWCNDWRVCSLGAEAVTDPPGPESDSNRVARGGAYYNGSDRLLSARRDYGDPAGTSGGIGFRCARSE